MPPCLLTHLVNYLFEMAPATVATFQEINAWQQCTGTYLTGWEAQTIHNLSIQYVNQQTESTKADCPPPWDGAAALVRRYKTETMRKNLRALANN